ncbi:CBS domain-containing protein [Guptibacillus algicola]|uniref:CBS domain-containing protein n=1 Tax=Guptibacillus algicola TaxID=225844 RepID=UPI001CD5004B|nr:CBS domain-containing protein [Alkalihalobacillus algicola]MCA0987943.1 CBS domain-containing protein [Alkalihalobacillus algicola]
MVSVAEVAKHVTACKREDSMNEAASIMKNEHVTIVPVLDDSDRLIGIVTDRAIAVSGIADKEGSSSKIEDVMENPPMTLTPEMKPEEAAKIMNDHRLTELPVVEDEKFIGIVSYFNLKEYINS